MKKIFFSFLIILFQCQNNVQNKKLVIVSHQYSPTFIPIFFRQIIENHWKDYAKIDTTYKSFCKNYDLIENQKNAKNFYTLKILNEFFTSETSSNGSIGKILLIPYFWHWVNPNPRYQITLTNTNKNLNTLLPPLDFKRYKSYADIDRTPFLFLSELFDEEPKYKHELLEKPFTTFGWCSEREMAFVALIEILGFKGKVITDNGHTWTETLVDFSNIHKKNQKVKFKIDNTYHKFQWSMINDFQAKNWEEENGNTAIALWYNEKSHDKNEHQKIEQYLISKKVMQKIENVFVNYLNELKNQ